MGPGIPMEFLFLCYSVRKTMALNRRNTQKGMDLTFLANKIGSRGLDIVRFSCYIFTSLQPQLYID